LLEDITHRALYKKLEEDLKKLPKDALVIVEATLLIEKGTYKDYDKLIVVYAPYEVCKRRAMLKGISEEDFERRWANQMPMEEKLRYADFVIDNSGSIEDTKEQVNKVYQELRLSAR
ncbi:MAG: dephospho-CoA kinase, partial [Aquificaceae bacterium]